MQFYRRVYNAQLADGRDVVVKVLPRHQAQHEAGILHSRAPHPKPRAIALPCELALPGDAVAFGHALGTAPPVRQRNRGNGAPSVAAAV